ncbi:uncharacterized protein [Zea mays]|uniref:uncharacterized protein n=1 Tax=Zea mays TaxID=4577 RepID=UPI00165264B2|nr:uncharacterized protein LOC111591127 [Zea mays]
MTPPRRFHLEPQHPISLSLSLSLTRAHTSAATVAVLHLQPRHRPSPSAPPRRARTVVRRGACVKLLPRDHAAGENLIKHHYFGPNPVYPSHVFRRRFRMHRPLFLRILRAIQREDDYFTVRCDATGLAGLGPLQKVCAALRILAYGLPSDAVDEYIQIGQTTARDCLIRFCRAIISSFSERYLRIPNHDDIARILSVNADRGFPGMLGSIDCMHWEWCKLSYCMARTVLWTQFEANNDTRGSRWV